MVCLVCLVPLFLIPIVNLLPLLFDLIMARVYRLFGWEYRKPVRTPPACPYKPAVASNSTSSNVAGQVDGAAESSGKDVNTKEVKSDDTKID